MSDIPRACFCIRPDGNCKKCREEPIEKPIEKLVEMYKEEKTPQPKRESNA